jgi:hypothetical protein
MELMATPSIIKVHIRVLITVWTLGFGWLLHDSSATSSGGGRCWSCIRTSVADKRECTGISDVLCHHIKPDQHKILKKYSLRLNYEVFQLLSLIAGLYLVGGVVSFLVIRYHKKSGFRIGHKAEPHQKFATATASCIYLPFHTFSWMQLRKLTIRILLFTYI